MHSAIYSVIPEAGGDRYKVSCLTKITRTSKAALSWRQLFLHRPQARPGVALLAATTSAEINPARRVIDPYAFCSYASERRDVDDVPAHADRGVVIHQKSRTGNCLRWCPAGGLHGLRHGAGWSGSRTRTRTPSSCPTAVSHRPSVIAVFDRIEDAGDGDPHLRLARGRSRARKPPMPRSVPRVWPTSSRVRALTALSAGRGRARSVPAEPASNMSPKFRGHGRGPPGNTSSPATSSRSC